MILLMIIALTIFY